jgi:solute:Na+ symporter, SSS family
VQWAGLRGVATTSYFKDAIMLVVPAVLVFTMPAHFAGGISGVFDRVQRPHPEMLTVPAGTNDHTWFITSMFVSAIGVAFLCIPHMWPGILSARDPRALRRNYAWLPVYELCLLFPMIVGFAAILALPRDTDPNGVAPRARARTSRDHRRHRGHRARDRHSRQLEPPTRGRSW